MAEPPCPAPTPRQRLALTRRKLLKTTGWLALSASMPGCVTQIEQSWDDGSYWSDGTGWWDRSAWLG